MSGFPFGSGGAVGLLQDQGAEDVVGNADAAGLGKDFEYSSVSIERQTPVPVVSPNGLRL
jgi:hypothetical protein